MLMRLRLPIVLLALLLAAVPASHACVGTACMVIYSTEPGGGALAIEWDFAAKKVQTFRSFCSGGNCLYSTIDPGFIHGTEPPGELYTVADGTEISLEVVSAAQGVALRLNGEAIAPGMRGLVGTAPDLHNHPSWQITARDGATGDYAIVFKLITDAPAYAESQQYEVLVTNQPTPTPSAPTPSATPTATRTPAAPACPGDCNGDGAATVDELVRGVGAALGSGGMCEAFDLDGDGGVSISELVAMVGAALNGCTATPTPTAIAATLQVIQDTIFTPRCAIAGCHDSSESGDLRLETGHSYEELVGVAPEIEVAGNSGMKRVDPMHPENSFLLVKLAGPPPDQGSRMPLSGDPLTEAEMALIGAWIAGGAPR
ncbi:MAG: hypothetical protein AB7N53_14020 [Candidatus Binatia bacterium]